MRNMVKFLGIVALVAVIGLSMAACGSDGGNSSGGSADVAKTIVIEGVSGYQTDTPLMVWVFSDFAASGTPVNAAVGGPAIFTGSTSKITVELTVPAKAGDHYAAISSKKWTGSGSYYIYLVPGDGDGSWFLTTAGNIYGTGQPQKYNITEGVTTLSFSNFIKQYNVWR